MSKELTLFQYKGQQVRTVIINGEVWFVAKDVCVVLEIVNPTRALEGLDDDEKGLHAVKTPGGDQTMNVINESGLYSLVFKSRKPEAKAFQRWVKREVLPSIRKHGMYATDELLDNPDLLVEVATKLRDERRARLAAEAQVSALKPKAEYAEQVLSAVNGFNIEVIAMQYGLTAQKLNKLLQQWGVQYKRRKDGPWLLTAEYADKGYVVMDTFTQLVPDLFSEEGFQTVTRHHMKWTERGREFLHRLLTAKGYGVVA